MGLDTSHDCWHGAYSAFMRWREKLAEVAGLPPLALMEGFYAADDPCSPFKDFMVQYPNIAARYTNALPISWDCLKTDVLHELLYHSDCEGTLPHYICGPLADRIEELLPLLPDEVDEGHIGNWQDKTQKFIDGLRAAAAAKEDVEFR